MPQNTIIKNSNGGEHAGVSNNTLKTSVYDATGNAITMTNGFPITSSDSFSIDAFGRWRVSNPETIFDSKQIHNNQPLFWDDQEVSGGSTSSSYNSNRASSVLGVAGSTAGNRTRQTFMRFNYQPGKSQLILLTGILSKSGGGTGITRLMGYGDDNNGLFLKDNEGTIQFVRRTSSSGSPVDNVVNQASWNLDTMDGNGASGITLDFTKTQILFIDFEWLGVGRVRMGFVIDGKIIYAHAFNNANNLDVVYMSTPNLPLRLEIENDGTGVASELEHICCSVMSEGGTQDLGILRHKDSGSVSGLSAGTKYAILGLRLKSANLDADVKLENISVLATTNDTAHWEIIFNPTIEGTFTYGDETNSVVQTAIGGSTNTVTGGTEVDGGYFSQTQSVLTTVPNALRLGSAIDGTRDEIALVVQPISNNITVQASITWREES